ncbi:EAL domain-containing protein [Pseudophaeobacter sp.]|uniref:putative bifunctional diguanylate cyclase/phosphodiesterase n=1 Tax=Pseudophaeobacter sp. TaxID=1971739 RepID=UPI0032973EC1
MYTMVVVNTIALAYTHVTLTPAWLGIYIPAVLVSISALRTFLYWRVGKIDISAQQARQQLRQTIVLAGVLGGVFSFWALALFPYGNAQTQGHVAFFSGVTCLGIMVCLMHLRAAAFVLSVAAVGPTAVYLIFLGPQESVAVGLNLVIVSAAILCILSTHSHHFGELISNQEELKRTLQRAHKLSKENEILANTDSLTGLANRRRFMSELDQRLRTAASKEERFAVGILDLDGFKPVNDIYGHIAGDRLLIEVGQRLSELDSETFIARLGGDEFGLILKGDLSDAELQSTGDMICDMIEKPFDLDSFTANIGGTLGLAQYPDAGTTAKDLFERSDYLLYVAKERSRGKAILFSERHRSEILETTGIKRCLQEADLEKELSVNFQFVVDSITGVPVGAEALARWSSPTLGPVSPDSFIKNAEQSGMINEITEILLRKSLDEALKWPGDLFVSFNLSAHDIGSSRLIEKICDIVKNSELPAERLTFEITETSLLLDLERANTTLKRLKGLGSKVALDDFGTGYSSLSYVQKLPIDRLKIDRSFISDLEASHASQAVVKTILDLCGNLGLDCIVEGVETEGQLATLRNLGHMKVQGYYFSKPLPGCDALTYLQMLPVSRWDANLRA